MIEKERIAIMLRDIERYFADLETIHVENKKELEEPEKKHAISMLVFSITNRVLDISSEIIAGTVLKAPESYRDTFDVLKNAKVITPQTAERMIWLSRYRNIIAHEYYVLGPDEIYQLRKKIHDVEQFLSEIKRYIK